MDKVDLDSLGLTYGDAKQIQGEIEPEEVLLGGQDYSPQPESCDFLLDVSRTSTGYALRLRFEVALAGPCYRCLEPARVVVRVDAREVDQPPEPMPARTQAEEEEEDEASAAELESPYVESGVLDLASWSHDALILSLPNQIVCQSECLGLCAWCGESLNGASAEDHDHGQNNDPRWSRLRELG